MKIACLIVVCIVLFLSFGAVYAQNPEGQGPGLTSVHTIQLPVIPVELKPGPGVEKTSTLCNICHGTDYITMQPNFARGTWTAEVNKMVKVMGAPINSEDVKTIIDYLVTNYGTGT